MDKEKVKKISASLDSIMENLMNIQKSIKELDKDSNDNERTPECAHFLDDMQSTPERIAFKNLAGDEPLTLDDIHPDTMRLFKEEVEFLIAREMRILVKQKANNFSSALPVFSSDIAKDIAKTTMDTLSTWTNRIRWAIERGSLDSIEDIKKHLSSQNIPEITCENIVNITEGYLSMQKMEKINPS